MFIIVDERELVTNGYACRFHQEGVASAGFGGEQFIDWVDSAIEGDLRAVFFIEGDWVLTVDLGTHDIYKG